MRLDRGTFQAMFRTLPPVTVTVADTSHSTKTAADRRYMLHKYSEGYSNELSNGKLNDTKSRESLEKHPESWQ